MAAVFFGSFLLWLLSLLSAQWGMLSVVRISLWKLEFLAALAQVSVDLLIQPEHDFQWPKRSVRHP